MEWIRFKDKVPETGTDIFFRTLVSFSFNGYRYYRVIKGCYLNNEVWTEEDFQLVNSPYKPEPYPLSHLQITDYEWRIDDLEEPCQDS